MFFRSSNTGCFPLSTSGDRQTLDTHAILQQLDEKMTNIQQCMLKLSDADSMEGRDEHISSKIEKCYSDISTCIKEIKKSIDLQVSANMRHVNNTTSNLSTLCVAQQHTINWQSCALTNWQIWWDAHTRRTGKETYTHARSAGKETYAQDNQDTEPQESLSSQDQWTNISPLELDTF